KPAETQPPADKSEADKLKEGETQSPTDAKKDENAKKDEAATKNDDPSAKKDDATKSKEDAAAKNPLEQDKEVEKILAERKRIDQENKRKKDEYQALVKKGQENVKNLNLRFGDWYFVVDDDVFRKIRLSRDKV